MLDVDARHRDLLFLLGLAPLALGCAVGATGDGPQFTSASPGTPPGDDDTDEDDTSTGSGDGGSTGGDPTGPADDDPSASASVSVSASASVGDDGTTSGASSSESLSVSASASVSVSAGEEDTYYGPPPMGYACEGYAYVIAGCYYGGDPDAVQYYVENCELAIAELGMLYGPACAAAFEETRACISELSCLELMMYGTGSCVAEVNAYEAACS